MIIGCLLHAGAGQRTDVPGRLTWMCWHRAL